MIDVIPVWAHVALLVAAIGLAALIYLRDGKVIDRLRKRLNQRRKRLDEAEAERDAFRKRVQAQSIELARYRGQLPVELRVTQIMLDDEGKPLPEPEAKPRAPSAIQPKPKA